MRAYASARRGEDRRRRDDLDGQAMEAARSQRGACERVGEHGQELVREDVIVITVEPEPDDRAKPYAIRALAAVVPAGAMTRSSLPLAPGMVAPHGLAEIR